MNMNNVMVNDDFISIYEVMCAMIGKNRQLVTNEPVEFQK